MMMMRMAVVKLVSRAAVLPIVWPGVDSDVPSGDGWKGCWTLVRMILGNDEKADVSCFCE